MKFVFFVLSWLGLIATVFLFFLYARSFVVDGNPADALYAALFLVTSIGFGSAVFND